MLMENKLQSIETALSPSVTPIPTQPTRSMLMIIVRHFQEQRARDSLRRRGVGAWWPNYPKDENYKEVVKSGHIMVEVSVLGRPTSFDVLPHQIEPALEENKRIRA
jgi:hypothetical protein